MHNKQGLIAGQIVAIVVLVLVSTVAILQLTGTINILGNQRDLCPGIGDNVLCGICNKDKKLSDNPYAGQCVFCPSGTTCVGDVCGEMKCIPNNMKPTELPPGSGCCEPACLVTEKDKCPGDLGFTFHEEENCDSVPQCKAGCCTPACVMDKKQKCEDTGFAFHDESCDKLPQCKTGCCMPVCVTKTQEMCETGGFTFRNERCDELPQCKTGCCTPSCTMKPQAACEFVGIDKIQYGTFHDESCDKILSCKRPGRWEGTITFNGVFNGIWTCNSKTTAKISICMEQQGQTLTGVITFPEGFKDTTSSPEPDAICPGGVHCSGGPGGQCSELVGHFDSNGNFNLTSLTLDGGSYVFNPYNPGENVQSSAIVVGNSMTVTFSSSGSSGRDITSSTIGSFTANKVSDNCNT